MTLFSILLITILAQVIFWTAVFAYAVWSSKAASKRMAEPTVSQVPYAKLPQGISGVEEVPVERKDTQPESPPRRFY